MVGGGKVHGWAGIPREFPDGPVSPKNFRMGRYPPGVPRRAGTPSEQPMPRQGWARCASGHTCAQAHA
eukprot:10828495-Alexandrium_andersonii.AAC.1